METIDNIFTWISEFAPVAAIVLCFGFANAGNMPFTVAAGFLAVVLEAHNVALEVVKSKTTIQVEKGLEFEHVGDEDERRIS